MTKLANQLIAYIEGLTLTQGRIIFDYVTTDWTHCENIRARLHVMVRRILRKHGYPSTRQERLPKPSSNKPHPSPKTRPQPDARQTASYPAPTTGTCSYSS